MAQENPSRCFWESSSAEGRKTRRLCQWQQLNFQWECPLEHWDGKFMGNIPVMNWTDTWGHYSLITESIKEVPEQLLPLSCSWSCSDLPKEGLFWAAVFTAHFGVKIPGTEEHNQTVLHWIFSYSLSHKLGGWEPCMLHLHVTNNKNILI